MKTGNLSIYKNIIFFIVLLLTYHGSVGQNNNWLSISLASVEGEPKAVKDILSSNGLMVFVLDPDCPVSQKYGATIRELSQEYEQQGITSVAVYPVVGITKDKIRKFAEDYNYPFTHLLDPQLKFARAISAEVTPEVYLISKDAKLLYRGAIDNWFYELGRYRRIITEHYLKDALKAYLQGETILKDNTQAIGCFIGSGMSDDNARHH